MSPGEEGGEGEGNEVKFDQPRLVKMALRKMFALSDANFVVRYLISTLNKPFLQVLTFINGTLKSW